MKLTPEQISIIKFRRNNLSNRIKDVAAQMNLTVRQIKYALKK